VKSKFRKALVASLVIAGFSASAQAQQDRRTPKHWSYDVDQRGNRVDRANRVTKPDGSWREETRQGNCVAIKERSATGEYKESRQCNPAPPAKPQ
jgi:hypothetical protein